MPTDNIILLYCIVRRTHIYIVKTNTEIRYLNELTFFDHIGELTYGFIKFTKK